MPRDTNSKKNNSISIKLTGEFPWTLMLLKNSDLLGISKEVYLCAASLIAPDMALTTAHCVNNSDQYFVRAGEWDTSSVRELFATQVS